MLDVDEQTKLLVGALLESHKQGQDAIKSFLIVLGTIITSFAVAISAIFTAFQNYDPAKLHSYLVYLPYPIIILTLFEIYLLYEISWRGGYQKYIEERLNNLLGEEAFLWEVRVNGPHRWRSAPILGFTSAIVITFVGSIFIGVNSANDMPSLTKLAFYGAPSLLVAIGFVQVFIGRDHAYRLAAKSHRADELARLFLKLS